MALPVFALSQDLGRRLGGENGPRRATAADRPAPKLPDGKVDLSGVWTGGGDGAVARLLKPGELDALMLPWAKKAGYADRRTVDGLTRTSAACPGGRCGSRAVSRGGSVQHPTTNSTHIFMLQEGNAHTYRQIFMDGRKHPEDPSPTWYGHSIGRWEGDTLVVDTIGLNDKFWLDRGGTPHTEKLHLVERWTRHRLHDVASRSHVEDPGAFTRPFTVTYTARLGTPDSEILEYICIENNQYGLAQGLALPNTKK